MADGTDRRDDGRSSRLPPPLYRNRMPAVDASSFTYTPFYCEENVYFLCKKLCILGLADQAAADLFVVFISNDEKKVPLWRQKASRAEDGMVVWDYHVICIQVRDQKTDTKSVSHFLPWHPRRPLPCFRRINSGCKSRRNANSCCDLVWDLDSSLPLPCPLDLYDSQVIRPLTIGDSAYSRLFRVVHAPLFLAKFASDRSHMKDGLGNWSAPPPTYEPIVAQDGTRNNIGEYITITKSDLTSIQDCLQMAYTSPSGVVVTEAALRPFILSLSSVQGAAGQP